MHEGSPSSTGRATTTSATVQGRSGTFRVRPVFSFIRFHHTQATRGAAHKTTPRPKRAAVHTRITSSSRQISEDSYQTQKRYGGGSDPNRRYQPHPGSGLPHLFSGFIKSTAVPTWPPIIHETRPNSGGSVHQAKRACGLQAAARRSPAGRPATPFSHGFIQSNPWGRGSAPFFWKSGAWEASAAQWRPDHQGGPLLWRARSAVAECGQAGPPGKTETQKTF